jgi:hypothetical protein
MLDLLGDLSFRDANVVSGLEVEPELRARLKPMAKPECRVAGNPSLALDDLCNAVSWHIKLTCEFRRGDAEFRQLVGKNFAGVNGRTGHRLPLGLMTIDDLDVQRTSPLPRPLKANPPLDVYPDAVLPLTVAFERFKSVALERSEIGKGCSSVEYLQPFVSLSNRSLEFPDELTSRKRLGSLVAITQDHAA